MRVLVPLFFLPLALTAQPYAKYYLAWEHTGLPSANELAYMADSSLHTAWHVPTGTALPLVLREARSFAEGVFGGAYRSLNLTGIEIATHLPPGPHDAHARVKQLILRGVNQAQVVNVPDTPGLQYIPLASKLSSKGLVVEITQLYPGTQDQDLYLAHLAICDAINPSDRMYPETYLPLLYLSTGSICPTAVLQAYPTTSGGSRLRYVTEVGQVQEWDLKSLFADENVGLSFGDPHVFLEYWTDTTHTAWATLSLDELKFNGLAYQGVFTTAAELPVDPSKPFDVPDFELLRAHAAVREYHGSLFPRDDDGNPPFGQFRYRGKDYTYTPVPVALPNHTCSVIRVQPSLEGYATLALVDLGYCRVGFYAIDCPANGEGCSLIDGPTPPPRDGDDYSEGKPVVLYDCEFGNPFRD